MTAATRQERRSRWARVVDSADGLLNAILVKDIRAWLHSKKFLFVFFISMVLIQGTTFVFTVAPETGGGDVLFIVLAAGLGFVVVGILPFLMHDRFTDELASGSTELALISRMTPGQLVRGKIASGLLASLLFLSAAAPSFTIAYMLGGLDLVTLAYSMILLTFMAIVAMIAAILLVAITGRRKVKILGVLFIVGGANAAGAIVGVAALMREATLGLTLAFVLVNLVSGAYVSLFALFFYTVAVSRLSFEADNRDARPRLALSALSLLPLFITTAFLLLAEVLGPGVKDADEVMTVVVAFSLGVFLFGSLFILTTPDRISARVRSRASRIPPLRLLLYPGQGRLYAYILAHLVLFSCAAFLPAFWRFEEEVVATLFAASALVAPLMLGGCTLAHHVLTLIPWFRKRRIPRGIVTSLFLFLWAFAFAPVAAVVEGADLAEQVMLIHPFGTLSVLGDDASLENVVLAIVVDGVLMAPAMIYWLNMIGRAVIEDHRMFGARKAGRKMAVSQPATLAAKLTEPVSSPPVADTDAKDGSGGDPPDARA